MRKKLIIFITLSCCLAVFLCSALIGCKDSEPLLIVYLGDSIGAGFSGPTPLTERENYAYYGVVGIRNEYKFINRAVGGHTTEKMLDLIQQEEFDARMTNTYIREADIIHVSILGNDFLLSDVGEIMLDAAGFDDYSKAEAIIAESSEYFGEIIRVLKEYNEDAVLLVQTVYNPIFQDWLLITDEVRNELADMGVTAEQFRAYADILLEMLNGIIYDYLDEHPNAFHVIDAYSEFNRIYGEDKVRGRALIYSDDVHPSSEGHAVIADLIQEKLEELNLADNGKAVENYKELRKNQLNRMYKDTVDTDGVNKQIDEAKTCYDITKIYFAAVKNIVPAYY